MTDWAPPIEKVTALITRPGPDGVELLVFEHPIGELQIPTGTVEHGEGFQVAAIREAWEETGALGLELVGEVATLRVPYAADHGAIVDDLEIGGHRFTRGRHADVVSIDGDLAEIEPWTSGARVRVRVALVTKSEERHVFHVRCTVEMPDEWWVVTPDGDGTTWRCCWVPFDRAAGVVVASNRPWAEAGYPHVDASRDPRPLPRPPLPAELDGLRVWEAFLAPPRGATRFVTGLVEQDDAQRCSRAHGVCVTDDGSVVVIQDADGRWDLPGGGKEPEETTIDTFVREVAEEACATVTAVAVVAVLLEVELDGQGGPSSAVDAHAQLWARVELDRWDPRFETIDRRLVTPDEAVATTVLPHLTAMLLDHAVLIDPALDWKPRSEVDG